MSNILKLYLKITAGTGAFLCMPLGFNSDRDSPRLDYKTKEWARKYTFPSSSLKYQYMNAAIFGLHGAIMLPIAIPTVLGIVIVDELYPYYEKSIKYIPDFSKPFKT